MLLLLLACESSKLIPTDEAVTPALTLDGPTLVDLLREEALPTFTLSASNLDADRMVVRIEPAEGAAGEPIVLADDAALEVVAWDGFGTDGLPAAAGAYTVVAEAWKGESVVASDSQPLQVIKPGVTEVRLEGGRVPLIWHRNNGRAYSYLAIGEESPVVQLASITHDDGSAAAFPAVWSDLASPPGDATEGVLPAAYPKDTRPELLLTLAGEFDGVDLTIPGWEHVEGDVTPGGQVRFVRVDPLATTTGGGVGVVEETVSLQWVSVEGDTEGSEEEGGPTVASTQALPLRLYALYGPPTFGTEDSPHGPWVAVIDPLLRDTPSSATTAAAISDAIVDHVFHDLGLTYDTRYGASAYVAYTGWNFDDAVFDLTAFVDLSYGEVINCTDAAAIVESFGNMLGVDLSYAIINPGFELNYLLAIGGEEFTSCPFGSGRCGFNYHAVVTSDDDASVIYDATLALDGDDDPGSTPNSVLMVESIPGEEYMDRLVRSGSPTYNSIQKGMIQ